MTKRSKASPNNYNFPPLHLLESAPEEGSFPDEEEENRRKECIRAAMKTIHAGIKGEIRTFRGPALTRYEFQPDDTVRMSTIRTLRDTLARNLGAKGVRVEAPVPGKTVVGVEIPNTDPETVRLRSLIGDARFSWDRNRMTVCLGKTVGNNPVIADIRNLPHLLIAGRDAEEIAGCLHEILISLMCRATPQDVRLVLIDTRVEGFGFYRDNPLLAVPVVTDPPGAKAALRALCDEMERRFDRMRETAARSVDEYNGQGRTGTDAEPMPRILVAVNELSFLTANDPDNEAAVCRLCMKGRACGIHLILGTQEPCCDVITGLLRVNIPSRIAFAVPSKIESRIILDRSGAECLCGAGDMLFRENGTEEPVRVQAASVSEREVRAVTEFLIRKNGPADYDPDLTDSVQAALRERTECSKTAPREPDETQSLLDALGIGLDCGKISVSLLQRRMRIGFGRAARLVNDLEKLGYIESTDDGSPRRILISQEQYETLRAAGKDLAADPEVVEGCIYEDSFSNLSECVKLPVHYMTPAEEPLVRNRMSRIDWELYRHFGEEPGALRGLVGYYVHFALDDAGQAGLSRLTRELKAHIKRWFRETGPVYADLCVTFDPGRFPGDEETSVCRALTGALTNVPFNAGVSTDFFAERIHAEAVVFGRRREGENEGPTPVKKEPAFDIILE